MSETIPQTPTSNSNALDSRAKAVLKVAIVTLFIDLVGFSIIFPLFPAMLEYYGRVEADHGAFAQMNAGIAWFARFLGTSEGKSNIVLFGGLLGSLYSLLQFVCAPILGRLSDHYGRRPVLLVSVCGTALSYLIWVFAGQFWLLLLARFVGGIMSGNISTASAIVADVTNVRNRSKGMAFIGIAFGVGFICGPVIGGLSASIDLTAHLPQLAAWGINPFSMPALVALVMSLINIVLIAVMLPETRPANERDAARIERTLNPISALRGQHFPGVSQSNLAYFLFLTAFSGMEFSLTFLAHERFGYTPRQNAMLLLFVGVVLALVQGGYVQRKAHHVGPRRMTSQGLVFVVPGMILVGIAHSIPVLYAGLFFMAVGAAQVIPCLTSLVSLYTPPHVQGRVLGAFRSLGALARAIGPILACILFWRLGSQQAYVIAAVCSIAPLLITMRLPEPTSHDPQVLQEGAIEHV